MKKKRMRSSCVFLMGIVLLLSAVILTPLPARAADNYWTGETGIQEWKYTDNWSLGDVPANGENAFLINAGSVTLNMFDPYYSVPLTGSLQSLLMDGSSTLLHGDTYTLNIDAPPDTDSGDPDYIMNPPAIGFGVNGTYGFSGGTLNSLRTVVGVGGLFGPGPDFIPTNNPPLIAGGGLGIFNQSGGTTTNHGQLWVGFNTYGEYNLSGGTLNIGGYEMGTLVIGGKDWYGKTYVGEGVFNQTDGDVYVNGLGLFMADGPETTGTYNLGPDGTLTVSGYYVIGGGGGTATFNQTGGTNTANGMLEVGGAGTGTYNLAAGSLNTDSTIVGAWGTGTFNQGLTGDGGTHTVIGTLEVGSHGLGTYNLIDGDLATGSTIVGNQGTGTFNQGKDPDTGYITAGGTHTVNGDLILGNNSEITGTYNLYNGDLDVGGWAIIGQYGSGYFNQSGGDFTLTGGSADLYLGSNPGSYGQYDMTDGYLDVGWFYVGWQGEGVFNQSNGTVTLLYDNGEMNVGTEAGSIGTYNLSDTGVLDASITTLYIGRMQDSTGTYNLTGTGVLNTSQTIVGREGTGTFNQGKDPLTGDITGGGTHTVNGDLSVGLNTDGVTTTGVYNLYSGNLKTTGREFIGGFADPSNTWSVGTGVFNQYGGMNRAGQL